MTKSLKFGIILSMFAKLKKHRFLFEELVKRDFDRKYKGSFLGAAWSVLNPLLSLLIMRFIFGHFFGSAIPHFTTYLFCGNIVFSFFSESSAEGLMALYRQEETEEREALKAGTVTEKWQSGGEARLAMTYIYDHLDAFRLLICKSKGTRYEGLLHDLAAEEEKTTMAMMDLLKANGVHVNEVDSREFHLLVTANVNAVFQAVEHDFTRDEALRYADTLDRFFAKGWQAFFGY